MERKRISRFLSAGVCLLSLTALTGCGEASDEGIVIHALNCEDYIGEDEFTYVDDAGNERDFPSVIEAFEILESEKLGKNVTVVYDTYDTNETMLSSLKTGKSSYELILASDYTIQRMMTMGLIQKLDLTKLPNYEAYVSPYLNEQLGGLEATVDGKTERVADYSIGYMWGTLGILYNPAKIQEDKGYDEDKIKVDMASWDSLWDAQYKGEMSVKDSMRDTYSVGIMEYFKKEIEDKLHSYSYFDEDFNLDPDYFDEAVEEYNPWLSQEIFNRCDEETVGQVEKILLSLKENIFGFEVDSGKEDMVKGLIGMNFAWSGDAVFSMDTAEEPEEESSKRYLYYSVPKTGGNLWLDGWMMGKDATGEARDVSYDFLDFISTPQIAAANMEYIGYTSFIAGDSILDLVRSWYDPRFYDEDVVSVDDGDYEGEDGQPVPYSEMEGYEDWTTVNLQYMFEGTLSDDYLPDALGDTPETNPYLFYTDEYEEIEYEGQTAMAGRQFYAQYPPQEILPKLAIMNDYGDNNKYVLEMWENVKSNNLPLAGVIVFAVILLSAGAALLASFLAKRRFHKLRVARRKANVRGK